MFRKDGLSKQIGLENNSSCCISGKMIFSFSKNMILFFRRKMKDDLSQKNTWKYDIFFKCLEKIVFPKKSCWNMIFLVLSGKIAFLFRKI